MLGDAKFGPPLGRRLPIVGTAVLGLLAATPKAHPRDARPTPHPDKSRDHLFHRTPAESRRGLASDRPDVTESPITVDAGWFQVEADLFTYRRASGGGISEEEMAAPVLNLKAGLLHNLDLQVVLSPWQRTEVEDRAVTPRRTTTASGFGDLQVRAKLNLWGNDGGRTALAVMPFLHLPTGADNLSTDAVEGGLILPFAFALPAGFEVGLMEEAAVVRDTDGSGYHAEFLQSIALGRGLTARLSAYLEFVGAVSTDAGSSWVGLVNVGINILLTDDLKLDAGLNRGVTRAAPDWNPFVGVTWRF